LNQPFAIEVNHEALHIRPPSPHSQYLEHRSSIHASWCQQYPVGHVDKK
jgi:hypothetical protein